MTENLEKAFADFSRAAAEMARSLTDVITSIADNLAVNFGPCLSVLAAYKAAEVQHPKWVHMAGHAKRKRIRKKYHDRIMREYGGAAK